MLTDAELADARTLAAETHTATITLTHPGEDGGGGWDPDTGPTPSQPTTPYHQGPARVEAISSNRQPADAAGQQVTVRAYKVSLPYDAPEPRVGDLLEVTAHDVDPRVVGKTLTVTAVVYAGIAIERVAYADLDLTNQTGGA